MPDYNSQAIVLRAYDLKESDRLIILFTQKYGKLAINLKSGSKITSKMAGHLTEGSVVEIEWVEGRRLSLITGANQVLNSNLINQNLNKIIYLKSVLKILDKIILEREPSFEIFELTLEWIKNLYKIEKNENLELIYQSWWWKVLVELGLSPNLEPISQKNNFFDFELGGLIKSSRKNNCKVYSFDEINLVSKLIAQPMDFWMKAKFEKELAFKGREILQNFVVFRDLGVDGRFFARKLS